MRELTSLPPHVTVVCRSRDYNLAVGVPSISHTDACSESSEKGSLRRMSEATIIYQLACSSRFGLGSRYDESESTTSDGRRSRFNRPLSPRR